MFSSSNAQVDIVYVKTKQLHLYFDKECLCQHFVLCSSQEWDIVEEYLAAMADVNDVRESVMKVNLPEDRLHCLDFRECMETGLPGS